MTDKQPEALRLAELLEARGILEAADELRRLHQVDVAHVWWLEKTEWVQESSEASDLGKHRADVIKQRLDSMTAQRDELLAALIGMVNYYGTASANLDELHKARAAIAKAAGGAACA